MTPEIFDASIVAVGSFNPPIITVDWLLKHGLIGQGDADAARSKSAFVVSREITRFSTDAFSIQVLDSQLSVTSLGPVSPTIADLAFGVLSLLPHTPVTAIGINFMGHYKMHSPNAYHQVGDSLAPKPIWEKLFPGKTIGLADLMIRVQDGTRDEPSKDPNVMNITVQPSTRVRHGVYLRLNDHYGWDDESKPLGSAADAAQLVRGHWNRTHQFSLDTFERILTLTATSIERDPAP